MKHILLFLSFFLVSLLGAKGLDETPLMTEGAGVESVLQTGEPSASLFSSILEMPEEGEACIDTESLARQYRVCGRGQRSFSVQHFFFGKDSAYRAAKKRLDILSRTINQVYTTLPCQSWEVPSDHYVFGMRHILI